MMQVMVQQLFIATCLHFAFSDHEVAV